MEPVKRELSVPPRNKEELVLASLKANSPCETEPCWIAVLKKGFCPILERAGKARPRILLREEGDVNEV